MKRRQVALMSAALACVMACTAYAIFFAKIGTCSHKGEPHYIYIDKDDNADSVCAKSSIGWRWKVYAAALPYKVRKGCYLISPEASALATYRMLRNGHQAPVRLTIPSTRTMERLAGKLAHKLELDSTAIADALTDSAFCARYGYDTATIPSLFVPNTYEVYWDITLDNFMKRMQKEHEAFWNKERQLLAKSLDMTPEEISTLASIVDEETANDGEKPMVAGMYLNRLRIDMPLQADPTVRFALGDFSIRRVRHEHLKVESPYNTYINTGLPPGPICIPSIAGIDAVLHHKEHPYLYMCAKEDFSGTHNFAVTYSEHLKNARLYAKALDERNIQ